MSERMNPKPDQGNEPVSTDTGVNPSTPSMPDVDPLSDPRHQGLIEDEMINQPPEPPESDLPD